jgi:hypothetical protein
MEKIASWAGDSSFSRVDSLLENFSRFDLSGKAGIDLLYGYKEGK